MDDLVEDRGREREAGRRHVGMSREGPTPQGKNVGRDEETRGFGTRVADRSRRAASDIEAIFLEIGLDPVAPVLANALAVEDLVERLARRVLDDGEAEGSGSTGGSYNAAHSLGREVVV